MGFKSVMKFKNISATFLYYQSLSPLNTCLYNKERKILANVQGCRMEWPHSDATVTLMGWHKVFKTLKWDRLGRKFWMGCSGMGFRELGMRCQCWISLFQYWFLSSPKFSKSNSFLTYDQTESYTRLLYVMYRNIENMYHFGKN